MYEFDCKPLLNETGLDTSKWQTIAFEHKVIHLEYILHKSYNKSNSYSLQIDKLFLAIVRFRSP